jgi:hypothetical protein
MQKIDKLSHAIKVVALCLPPVVMSLIGLAALSRTKGGATGCRQQAAGTRAAGRSTQRRRMTARPAGRSATSTTAPAAGPIGR